MENVPINHDDSVFIVHTRSSKLQYDVYKGVAEVCLQLAIHVWDYHDFEFYRRNVVDHAWEGLECDPVRAHIGLPPFEVTRTEPDRNELLNLWRKCAAVIILYEADDISPGVDFELETIERGYLADFSGPVPLLAAVAIGPGTTPPIIDVDESRAFVAVPSENAKELGFVTECAAMSLLCWSIHWLQKSWVLGAFLLAQAFQDSLPLERLSRDSSVSRDFDFPEYARRNIKVKEELQARIQEDSVFGTLARRVLEEDTAELPRVLRHVIDWLSSHELDGQICKMGGILARHVKENYADARQRFACSTPFWMPELRN